MGQIRFVTTRVFLDFGNLTAIAAASGFPKWPNYYICLRKMRKRPGEGNHYRTFFSIIAATGRAATRDSCVRGEVPYITSAHRRAGARWSASENGSGGGSRRVI